MITRLLQRLVHRLRSRATASPLHTTSPSPHTPPPPGGGPSPHDPVLDGAVHRRSVRLADVPIDQLRHEARQLTLESGLVIDEEVFDFAMTGDGSVTDTLEGFARCDLCAREASEAFIKKQCTAEMARLASLCRVEHLARSEQSGLALCPRHTRRIQTPAGTVVLSAHEAEQLETDRLVQLPSRLLVRALVH